MENGIDESSGKETTIFYPGGTAVRTIYPGQGDYMTSGDRLLVRWPGGEDFAGLKFFRKSETEYVTCWPPNDDLKECMEDPDKIWHILPGNPKELGPQ